MRRLVGLTVASLMAVTTLAAQSTIAGTWQGETGAGASLVLDLAVKDTTLTGTLTRDGQSNPISDGKVSKDTFTFKAKMNDQLEGLSGERAGEDLKVWLDRQGPSKAIVLKRVKPAAPKR
jgi:hypothetical protein